MEPTKQSVIEDAMRLSAEDRAAVIEVLSHNGEARDCDESEIEAAWIEESRRRSADRHAGRSEPVEWDAVYDQMRGMIDDSTT